MLSTLDRGFTLIELLVVVSIVVLLIALLLPAIKKAKNNARIVMCASNLRQINIALQAYAYKNDGMGVAYHWERTGPQADVPAPLRSDFNDWTLVNYGGKDKDHHWDGRPSSIVEVPGRRKLNKYMNDIEGYLCPSDQGTTDGSSNGVSRWYDHTGTSYFYNSNWYSSYRVPVASPQNALARLSPWVLWGQPYESFGEPSRLYSVADANIMYGWLYWNAALPHGREFQWHDPPNVLSISNIFRASKCNVGFLDGYVAFLLPGLTDPGNESLNTNEVIIDPQWDE